MRQMKNQLPVIIGWSDLYLRVDTISCQESHTIYDSTAGPDDASFCLLTELPLHVLIKRTT